MLDGFVLNAGIHAVTADQLYGPESTVYSQKSLTGLRLQRIIECRQTRYNSTGYRMLWSFPENVPAYSEFVNIKFRIHQFSENFFSEASESDVPEIRSHRVVFRT